MLHPIYLVTKINISFTVIYFLKYCSLFGIMHLCMEKSIHHGVGELFIFTHTHTFSSPVQGICTGAVLLSGEEKVDFPNRLKCKRQSFVSIFPFDLPFTLRQQTRTKVHPSGPWCTNINFTSSLMARTLSRALTEVNLNEFIQCNLHLSMRLLDDQPLT